MRYIDYRVLQLPVQLLQFNPQVSAQLGIKIRQRFVKRNTSTSRTSALPIATRWRWPRKCSRLALQQRPDLQDFGSAIDTFANVGSRHLGVFQAKLRLPSTLICG